MGAAILILLILPFVDKARVLSLEYYPVSAIAFYFFICNTFLLG
jgi:quinol-cytochrome oxidoreductase complex cytochrome b subunit